MKLALEDGSAVVAVIDRGIGIPAGDVPRVFDSFYRGSNVGSATEGMGIGLPSVRRIAEAHGGSIAIDSQEGQGTSVTVRLPLKPDSTA